MDNNTAFINKEDYLLLCKSPIIFRSDWNTPDTYDLIFKPIPPEPGIYLLVANTFVPFKREIIYIGSSKNLLKRHSSHEKIKKYRSSYEYLQFYFKTCIDYKKQEIDLIRKVKPKLNKHLYLKCQN